MKAPGLDGRHESIMELRFPLWVQELGWKEIGQWEKLSSLLEGDKDWETERERERETWRKTKRKDIRHLSEISLQFNTHLQTLHLSSTVGHMIHWFFFFRMNKLGKQNHWLVRWEIWVVYTNKQKNKTWNTCLLPSVLFGKGLNVIFFS